MTHAVVAVGLTLATFASYRTGADARPSQATLAASVGTVRATVAAALRTLCELGWIEAGAAASGRPVSYRLTLPGGVQGAGQGVSSELDRGVQDAGQDMSMTSTPTSTSMRDDLEDVWAVAEAELAAERQGSGEGEVKP